MLLKNFFIFWALFFEEEYELEAKFIRKRIKELFEIKQHIGILFQIMEKLNINLQIVFCNGTRFNLLLCSSKNRTIRLGYVRTASRC